MQRLHKFISTIRSDLFRYSGSIGLKSFVLTYLRTPGFNYLFWHRLRSLYDSKFIGIILRSKSIKFGIDISPRASIGDSFYIGHFGQIFVNERAVIGVNCNISQGVTIGVARTGSKMGAPVIGNGVYIAPGAKIIGGITIGNNVAIGANSVVSNDLPDNAVAVGVPARVISYKGASGYINKVLQEPA